jgi:hypothetical protein
LALLAKGAAARWMDVAGSRNWWRVHLAISFMAYTHSGPGLPWDLPRLMKLQPRWMRALVLALKASTAKHVIDAAVMEVQGARLGPSTSFIYMLSTLANLLHTLTPDGP